MIRRRRRRRVGVLGRGERPVRVAPAIRRRRRRLRRRVGDRSAGTARGRLAQAVGAAVAATSAVATDCAGVATVARVARARGATRTAGRPSSTRAAGAAGRGGPGRRACATRSTRTGSAGARAAVARDTQGATVATGAGAAGARAAGASRARRRAGGCSAAGPAGATSATVATVTAVAGLGRGVAAPTGVGVSATAAVATVRGLAAAGLDAAVVLCVAADRRVVVLAVVQRPGVAAVGVLIDVAVSVVRRVDVDVGVVVVRDRAAVVAGRARVAPRDPAGGRRAGARRCRLALGGPVVAGVDVPGCATGTGPARGGTTVGRCRPGRRDAGLDDRRVLERRLDVRLHGLLVEPVEIRHCCRRKDEADCEHCECEQSA